MMIRCPRRADRMILESECTSLILTLATSVDLAPCLACEHGKKLAASCPFRPIRPVVVQAAQTVIAAPDPVPGEETGTAAIEAAPAPTPGNTMADEIECLRNAVAYLLPKKYRTLGVNFVATVAARFGVTMPVEEVATAAGLTLKKERGVLKISQNKILRDFAKGI